MTTYTTMAYLNSTIIWRNGTLSDINFTQDCRAASKFVAKVAGQSNWGDEGYDSILEDYPEMYFPYAELVAVLRSVAPDLFGNMSSGAVVDWIDHKGHLAIYRYARNSLLRDRDGECEEELCQQLQWAGNPDVAGIGVSANYPTVDLLGTT